MNRNTIFHAERYGGFQKYVLYPPFIGTGVMMSQLLAWIYKKTQVGFGMEVAQIGMAVGVVVMLLFITFGFKFASKVDRAISEQRSIFGKKNRGKLARFLMRVWRYNTDVPEEAEENEGGS